MPRFAVYHPYYMFDLVCYVFMSYYTNANYKKYITYGIMFLKTITILLFRVKSNMNKKVNKNIIKYMQRRKLNQKDRKINKEINKKSADENHQLIFYLHRSVL